MTYENVPGWFDFQALYKNRVEEADKTQPSVFVEIGVFLGKSACFMGQEIKASEKPIKFYAVDPFDEPALPEAEGNFMASQREQGEKRTMVDIARDYIKGCELENHVHVVKASSKEALDIIVEPKVDFVYIDGDHAYESVRADINGWWPRIKIGSYIAGHDYGSFMSVNRAVREIFYRFSIETLGGSWLVRKTREDL